MQSATRWELIYLIRFRQTQQSATYFKCFPTIAYTTFNGVKVNEHVKIRRRNILATASVFSQVASLLISYWFADDQTREPIDQVGHRHTQCTCPRAIFPSLSIHQSDFQHSQSNQKDKIKKSNVPCLTFSLQYPLLYCLSLRKLDHSLVISMI